MRTAPARAGVASTIAYADRDRKMREIQRAEQLESIWSEPPRALLDGEVCFRILSPRGLSIGYDMEPAGFALNGAMISAPKMPLIQFVSDPLDRFGEFITKDKRQIERLSQPDMVAKGVVRWDTLHEVRAKEAGEEMATKLKDPSFLEGVLEGARKLGLVSDNSFLDALTRPSSSKGDEQQAEA